MQEKICPALLGVRWPEYVGGSLAARALGSLRVYCYELAMVVRAKRAALDALECVEFATDEGNGCSSTSRSTRRSRGSRTTTANEQRWSWEALKAYALGKSLDEDDDDDDNVASEERPEV